MNNKHILPSIACLRSLVFAGTFLMPLLVGATDFPVSDEDGFADALALVQPGDTIVWQNGTYDDQDTIRFEPATNGTAVAPITLRAETPAA